MESRTRARRRARRATAACALALCATLGAASPGQAATQRPIDTNTYFANAPNGLVTGNVHDGWKFVIERFSNDGQFVFGRVYGSDGFSRCGWLVRTAVQENENAGTVDPYSGCGSIGDVGNAYNSYSGSGVEDGSQTTSGTCTAYENVIGATGYRPVTVSGNNTRYRYTTNDGRWVMLRDANRPQGNNWLFAPASCVARPATTYAEFYNYLALQSHANARYVAAEYGGGTYLIANRTTIGPWERFVVSGRMTDGFTVSLKANEGTSGWVAAENGGGGAVNANRAGVGAWEQFTAIKRGGPTPGPVIGHGDYVALRTSSGAHYWSAENAGWNPINATRTAMGQWEHFNALFVPRAYP